MQPQGFLNKKTKIAFMSSYMISYYSGPNPYESKKDLQHSH